MLKNNSNIKNINEFSVASTGTELTTWAEQEREKGNDAFKAGDYEEALHLYTTSLMIDSSINAYNNRAMTCELKK